MGDFKGCSKLLLGKRRPKSLMVKRLKYEVNCQMLKTKSQLENYMEASQVISDYFKNNLGIGLDVKATAIWKS